MKQARHLQAYIGIAKQRAIRSIEAVHLTPLRTAQDRR